MIQRKWYTLLAVLLGLATGAVSTPVQASGFLLSEQSAEGVSMASAVSASTDEPAAVWYNPAALSFMSGVQASLTGVGYLAFSNFEPRENAGSIDADTTAQVVPGIFATARLNDTFALGFGVYIPFGLGIRWPEDWLGRVYGIESSITALNINPTVSIKILPNLSIGAGLDVVKSAVDFTNGLPTSGQDTVQIGGDAWGVGGNIGVLYRLLPEQLHFSATYRSRVKLDFSGKAHFKIEEPVFTTQLFDQDGTAQLTLPDIIVLGAMYRPHPKLRLGTDLYIVLWSTYDEIPIDFESPNTPDSGIYPDYRNILSLRLGADWALPVEGLKVRGAFSVDQNPAPKTGLSPTLPDGVTIAFGLGAGYQIDFINIHLRDLLVLYQPTKARQPSDLSKPPQSPEGTYRATVHLLGLTVTGRFGDGDAPTNSAEPGQASHDL